MENKAQLMNSIHDPFPLDRVTMPLIRVMRQANLSWAQREEIALAIQECLRQHKSLMDEDELHKQVAAYSQQTIHNTER